MNEELKKKQDDYARYINDHINNIKIATQKYGEKLCKALDINMDELLKNINTHDVSKWSDDEFEGYRQFFYPVPGSIKSKEEFNKAWLHHQNTNKHHPEYWIMRDDKDIKLLDMPNIYIAEMLLDWAAMGIRYGGSAYEYYNKEGHKKLFSDNTRKKVEEVINVMI